MYLKTVICISILLLESTAADNTLILSKMEGTCKEYPLPKAIMLNKIIRENGNTFVIQSMNVTKSFSRFGKLIIVPMRCPSKENLNYCENMRNVTIPHFGLLMKSTNSPWAKAFVYTPPLEEPVGLGLYRLEKKQVDTNWSIIRSQGYWRIKAIMWEEKTNDVIFCVNAEGEIR